MRSRRRLTALNRVAFRNLRRRPLRTALTILGVALGVSLIFAVDLGRIGTIDSFMTMIDNLSGKAALQVRAEADGGFDVDKLKDIRQVDGIKTAAPSISRVINLRAPGEKEPQSMQLLAVDPRADRLVRRYRLEAGGWLGDDRDILITAGFARRLSVRVGDRVSLLTPKGPVEVNVSGLLDETGVGQAAQGMVIVAPLKLGQEIYLLQNKITTVDVVVAPGKSVGAVKKRLANAVGRELTVERPEARGTSITQTVNYVMSSLNSLSLLVLMAGAFIIFGTLRMNVEEQERQFGVARALGASRPQVFLMAVSQGLFLGVFGSIAGLVIGYFLAGSFTDAVQGALQVAPGAASSAAAPALKAALGGVVMAVSAAAVPAWRASRLSPTAAMAGEAAPGRHRSEHPALVVLFLLLMGISLILWKPKTLVAYNAQIITLILGVVIISSWLVKVIGTPTAAVFHRLLGKDGLIAGRNLVRGRGQTAIALSTVVLSMIITLVAGELAASDRQFFTRMVNAAISYDLNIGTLPYSTFSANRRPPMDEKMAADIEAVKGVRRVDPVRALTVRGLEMDLFSIFMDTGRVPPRAMRVNEMSMVEAMRELDKGDRVIIGSAVTKKTGTKVGERIKLKTPAGRRYFKVVATIHHPANNGHVLLMSRRDLKKYWNDTATDYFQILIGKNERGETVKRRLIDKIGRPYGVTVVSRREEHTAIMHCVDKFLGTLDGMAFIAALISGLAVINAQIMNVMRRRREIGVMRAVGASRWLVRRLVVLEAAFLGLIGLLVGLVIGLPLSGSVIGLGREVAGFALRYVWPAEPLAAAVFIALGITCLASVYPAERAARIRIVPALRQD